MARPNHLERALSILVALSLSDRALSDPLNPRRPDRAASRSSPWLMMDKKGMVDFLILDVQLQGTENYTAWALMMQYNFRAFRIWGYI